MTRTASVPRPSLSPDSGAAALGGCCPRSLQPYLKGKRRVRRPHASGDRLGPVLPSVAARPAGRSSRTGGAPSETDPLTRPRSMASARLRRNHVAERPHDPKADAEPGFAAANGWDQPFEVFSDY